MGALRRAATGLDAAAVGPHPRLITIQRHVRSGFAVPRVTRVDDDQMRVDDQMRADHDQMRADDHKRADCDQKRADCDQKRADCDQIVIVNRCGLKMVRGLIVLGCELMTTRCGLIVVRYGLRRGDNDQMRADDDDRVCR